MRAVPVIVEWDIPEEHEGDGPYKRQFVPEELCDRWDDAVADYLTAKTGWVVVNWDFEEGAVAQERSVVRLFDREAQVTCENPYGWTKRRIDVECELFVSEIERYMGKVTEFQARHGS